MVNTLHDSPEHLFFPFLNHFLEYELIYSVQVINIDEESTQMSMFGKYEHSCCLLGTIQAGCETKYFSFMVMIRKPKLKPLEKVTEIMMKKHGNIV